jgi:cell wall-associated NlpC family hydrolase
MWGGTSTKGVDCSGFIRTTLLMHDIIIPRDASQQAYKGQHLDIAPDFSNLQPGDLLFFGTRATAGRKEQVHHVGMYIGNRHFIHSIGWVHLSSFNPKDEDYDGYDLNRLLFAARILPYINKQDGLNTTDHNSFYK